VGGRRYVTYRIGAFKGVPARMAAFYAFPKGGHRLPGLLHLHGGGQRAFLSEVSYYARRGYACLSINWGGREMENAKPGDPNTDWGAVDPTQRNVPGYFSLKPGPKQLDPAESPRNNNWYLLTLGARRGLTFLEKQPEVDPDRLGVYGLSMGGSLTVYVAGTDNRIKAAVPQVGGSGFATYPWPLLPEQTKLIPSGDLALYRATVDFESYAPHIQAPLLYLGATNDFNGIMDHTYRTGALIRHGNVRYAFAPHLNHRFTPEFQVASPLWFDQHLKGTFRFPATPQSKLDLNTDDHVPLFRIVPDASKPVEQVSIYYSLDPEPRARFWRSVEAKREGNGWSAKLPLMSLEQPLFAFANVYYRLDKPELPMYGAPTQTFAISSLLQKATAEELKRVKVLATDQPSLLIEDFSHGFRDWYLLSVDNPHHWQYWTRKINDPKWGGKSGHRLCFDVRSERPNRLIVVLTENYFRPYRGKQQDFLALVELKGGDWQTVTLMPADFKTLEGHSLKSWEHVDELGFRAFYDEGGKIRVESDRWIGVLPSLRNLRWEEVHRE
jgi:dienelactone hydrolase